MACDIISDKKKFIWPYYYKNHLIPSYIEEHLHTLDFLNVKSEGFVKLFHYFAMFSGLKIFEFHKKVKRTISRSVEVEI